MGVAAMLVMWPGPLENFHSLNPWRLYMKFGAQLAQWIFEEIVWNCQNMRVLGQMSKNDLDLLYSQIFMYSLRWLYIPIFRPKSSKLSIKSYVLAFSHIWPCRKKGQGQPRVIIWIILIVLEYPMLHTKFQGHGHLVLEKFLNVFTNWFWRIPRFKISRLKVFTIYGRGGHVGHVTWTVWINFCSLNPWRLYMKFGFNWPSGFWGDC